MATQSTRQLLLCGAVLASAGCSDAELTPQLVIWEAGAEELSTTGLYASIKTRQLKAGVEPFTPSFQLWTDGAEKHRWVRLPKGETIDTSDPDHWEYPVGTKFWKEFRWEDQPLETRFLEKTGEGPFGWKFVSFVWNERGTEAYAVPEGINNVYDTGHDIPSEKQCRTCHLGRKDIVLSFTAIQLAHRGDGLTIESLVKKNLLAGALSGVRTADLQLPGNEADQSALGSLHANCGHCHNPRGDGFDRNDMELWLKVDELSDLRKTGPYRTAVDTELSEELGKLTQRIASGKPSASAVYTRLVSRGREDLDMPPLGSKVVDKQGARLVKEWIESLE